MSSILWTKAFFILLHLSITTCREEVKEVKTYFIIHDVLSVNDDHYSVKLKMDAKFEWSKASVKHDANWIPDYNIERLMDQDILRRRLTENEENYTLTESMIVTFSCSMVFDSYPFDFHDCDLELSSWRRNSILHFIDNEAVSWNDSAITNTVLTYDLYFHPLRGDRVGRRLHFVRKFITHIYIYYIPIGLFVVISWGSLIIPPENIPGRITLIITTFLVLTNIANIIFENSPPSDSSNPIQLWVLVCIVFVFITVVEFIMLTALLRISENKDDFVESTRFAKIISIKHQVDSNTETTDVEQGKVERKNTHFINRKFLNSAKMSKYMMYVDYGFVILLSISFVCFNLFYWNHFVQVHDESDDHDHHHHHHGHNHGDQESNTGQKHDKHDDRHDDHEGHNHGHDETDAEQKHTEHTGVDDDHPTGHNHDHHETDTDHDDHNTGHNHDHYETDTEQKQKGHVGGDRDDHHVSDAELKRKQDAEVADDHNTGHNHDHHETDRDQNHEGHDH